MYDTPGSDYEDYDGAAGTGLNPAIFHLVLLCTVTVCVVSLGTCFHWRNMLKFLLHILIDFKYLILKP